MSGERSGHAGTALVRRLAFAAVLSIAPRPLCAQGAAEAPSLNWVRLPGAESCVTAIELAERVEQRTGRVLFVPTPDARLSVDGWVQPGTDSGYMVILQLHGRDGALLGARELTFPSESCAEITPAVALVIAVTLHPRGGLLGSGIPLSPGVDDRLEALFGDEPADPDPDSLPGPEATSDDASGRKVEGEDRDPTQQAGGLPSAVQKPIEWGMDAAPLASLGQLPGLGFGAGLHVHLLLPDFGALELGAIRWLAATARPAQAAGMLELTLTSVLLSVCPWTTPVAAARLCVGTEVGLLAARPRDFEVTGTATDDLVANATLSLRYRLPIAGPLHLRAGLVGLLPLVQRSYTIQALDGSSEQLFRLAQFAIRAHLGVGLTF